jgi:hypothetical protein
MNVIELTAPRLDARRAASSALVRPSARDVSRLDDVDSVTRGLSFGQHLHRERVGIGHEALPDSGREEPRKGNKCFRLALFHWTIDYSRPRHPPAVDVRVLCRGREC